MKTNELTGAALDWAVAKAEGYTGAALESRTGEWYTPSTYWSQGGPIIEREKVSLFEGVNDWTAKPSIDHPLWDKRWTGRTYLIAAMRCYVASKLGDDVEIPEELI